VNQYLKPSLFRTVLAFALLVSLVSLVLVERSCKDEAQFSKVNEVETSTQIDIEALRRSATQMARQLSIKHNGDEYDQAFHYVLQSFVASHWAICGGEWDGGYWSNKDYSSQPQILNLSGVLVSKVYDPNVSFTVYFIQMGEVSCEIKQESITPADKLNGVEWIGMVEFHAKAKRQFKEGTGWLAWENLEGYSKEFIVYKILKINGKWETAKFERMDFSHDKSILNFYPGTAPDCAQIPPDKTVVVPPVVDPKPNLDNSSVPPTLDPNQNLSPKTPFTSQATGQKSNNAIPSPSPNADPKPESKSADTSIVDVPESKWRNALPISSKGLNVRTQRPVFDELTTIPSGLTNLICEIEFEKNGLPINCMILQSSGTQLIDQPILDCMYRWRAAGSQLMDLPDGKTLKYRIRMLLK